MASAEQSKQPAHVAGRNAERRGFGRRLVSAARRRQGRVPTRLERIDYDINVNTTD